MSLPINLVTLTINFLSTTVNLNCSNATGPEHVYLVWFGSSKSSKNSSGRALGIWLGHLARAMQLSDRRDRKNVTV